MASVLMHRLVFVVSARKVVDLLEKQGDCAVKKCHGKCRTLRKLRSKIKSGRTKRAVLEAFGLSVV